MSKKSAIYWHLPDADHGRDRLWFVCGSRCSAAGAAWFPYASRRFPSLSNAPVVRAAARDAWAVDLLGSRSPSAKSVNHQQQLPVTSSDWSWCSVDRPLCFTVHARQRPSTFSSASACSAVRHPTSRQHPPRATSRCSRSPVGLAGSDGTVVRLAQVRVRRH